MLVAVVEIPAYCLTWLLTDHIGRKPTLSGAFLLSGAFCLAIQFVPAGKRKKKKEKREKGKNSLERWADHVTWSSGRSVRRDRIEESDQGVARVLGKSRDSAESLNH